MASVQFVVLSLHDIVNAYCGNSDMFISCLLSCLNCVTMQLRGPCTITILFPFFLPVLHYFDCLPYHNQLILQCFQRYYALC